MTEANLAIKSDTTSELYSDNDPQNDESYFGGSAIRQLINKTEDGGRIDSFLEDDSGSTSSISRTNLPILPRRNFSEMPQSSSHSIIKQKWTGYIDSINGQEFTAILSDSSGKEPDIKASFCIDEVSEGDRHLVSENAVFDWILSKERKIHGQIENKDLLVFRRFPMWKKQDLEKESKKVEEFNAWLTHGTTF